MIYGCRKAQLHTLDPCWDVVVIGAGVGGLICATSLALKGRKVLLLEQHRVPGGACSSFRRRGLRFDAGAHLFAGLGHRGMLNMILRRLGIEVPCSPITPMESIHFGPQRWDLPAGLDPLCEHLSQLFSHEATGLKELFVDLRRFYQQVLLRGGKDEEVQQVTLQHYLQRFVSDERLLALLGSQWPYLGSVPAKARAFDMLGMLCTYWAEGLYYPHGGSQAFADAIYHRFIAGGGVSVFGHRAVKIERQGDGFEVVFARRRELDVDAGGGVSRASMDAARSTTVRARAVVVNASERQRAILRGDEAARLARPAAIGALIVYLGLRHALPDVGGIYYENEAINRADGAGNPFFVVGNPARHDPTFNSGDRGGWPLSVFTVFPRPDLPLAQQAAHKEALAASLCERLFARVPGLRDEVCHREAATPATLTRYTMSCAGSCYGHSVALQQGTSPQDDTATARPVPTGVDEDLLCVGQWTEPGGGVNAVAVSGMRVAVQVEDWLCGA